MSGGGGGIRNVFKPCTPQSDGRQGLACSAVLLEVLDDVWMALVCSFMSMVRLVSRRGTN